ncbi:pilus (MSHA type) biogenesis protein MshL [Helicobacter cappadocius]|uniref:Pilus (MSHA type) biogenesis protein MshL n=1 Tax=Helicobacter cappadocius TaxID=3063998 RepID=A0AA90TAX3_9HELI|nr:MULTISPECIES: pilus (MSHA type) biogenesis protein MshL [unclassified Helicobacter]MDO7252414.1 pilus (MSHA type) biogenesis protein MshL [Helicobacter sp. faydin-H75]MDP2538281.1 pilus (MSHA type) biogenesis protein MshL [Helicobacter sp. faydin-H76]
MKKILFLGLLLSFSSALDLCNDKEFSLSTHQDMSAQEIIEEVANECSFSIVYGDSQIKELLKNQKLILNIKSQKLEALLNILSDSVDVGYQIKDGYIKFQRFLTKTFHIDYVATSRVGSSNTDVIFSQDTQNFYQNQFYGNSDFQDDAHQKALSIGTDQTKLNIGRSGTKIYSIDELNFWGELESELFAITYRFVDSNQPVKNNKKSIIINKGAGLVTITATPSQIKRVGEYIHSLNEKIQAQVLIDVNILTVSHNNIDTAGVNWAEIYNLGIKSEGENLLSLTQNGLTYGVNIFPQELTIGKILQFLKTYGKVSSVSNPKVLTINNQPAIISVGNVLRYSQNLVYQNSTNTAVVQNTGEQFPTVFSGVLLDVTPSISKDYVILKINPSITSAKDATIENQPNALKSPPNLSTNQLSSIVKLQNNQKIILGGLIHKTHSVVEKKLPILGSIPILKYLFSYKKQLKQTQEMVIIITPRIISSISPDMQDLGYDSFQKDKK